MAVHMTTEQAINEYDHDDIIERITQAVAEQNETFKEMFPVIEGGWVALVAGQHLLMVAAPGVAKCLAGDTEIRINRGGNGSRVSLKNLVERTNQDPNRTYNWDPSIPTYVQRNVDGYVRLSLLKAAWKSGVKYTYTLTTATGYSIRATDEHPFMKADGEFAQLGELSVGDYVCVNIGMNPQGEHKIQYKDRTTRFHPRQRRSGDTGFRMQEHRLIMESIINDIPFDEYLDILRHDEETARHLTYLTSDQVVHHKDHDPQNNDPDNLELLDPSSHRSQHDTGNNGVEQIGLDQIVSIEPYGEEMTYDIAVDDEPHNFMANDFVVHNSMLARDMSSRITQANYFETMLTPTSEPTSIIGPRDFEAMRKGHHVHRIDGFMPTSHIAFLDEVLNANGATLDNMLGLLNERVFHEDGETKPMPLWTVFMGTNQLSEQQRQAGWWDRIHQRHVISDVNDRDNMAALISEDIARTRDGQSDTFTTISLDELVAAHLKSLTLTIPDGTMQTLIDIRERLADEHSIRVSPRRMSATMRAAMAMAYLNGHEQVEITDLEISQHMLWTTSDQQPEVAHMVQEYVSDFGNDINELHSSYDSIKQEWDRIAADQTAEAMQKRHNAVQPWEDMTELLTHIEETRQRIEKRKGDTSQIDELLNKAQSLHGEIMEDGIQMSQHDESQS